MRHLKFHERKLLKKVDFINWELDNNLHELRVLRKYRVKREDYTVYNKLSREIRELARKIKLLPQNDPLRIEATATLLDKLHASGMVPTKKSLELCDKVTASSFCRRRLSSVLVRLRMAENMKAATTFIEHGHVRVGPQVVTDPAMLVTRTLEDFVTWTEESAIRKKVASYNDTRDDFDDA